MVLDNLVLSNAIETIPESAFAECYALSNVVIPVSVTMVESKAFENCSALVAVVIPDSLITIGENAFANCNALKYVHFSGERTTIYTINIFDGNDALFAAYGG